MQQETISEVKRLWILDCRGCLGFHRHPVWYKWHMVGKRYPTFIRPQRKKNIIAKMKFSSSCCNFRGKSTSSFLATNKKKPNVFTASWHYKDFLWIIAFSPFFFIIMIPFHFPLGWPELSAAQKFLSFHDLLLGEREKRVCVSRLLSLGFHCR